MRISDHSPAEILRELKRRRVFRVAAVYAVIAWGVIEVADVILPRLGQPEWTVTFVIALALLGFPVALVLAWAYDVTPDGVRRTEGEDSAAARDASAATGSTGARPRMLARRSVWFVLGILITLTGAWFALDRFSSGPGEPLDEDAVAVLPFRIAGAATELAYLREGMLDLLAAKLTGQSGGPRAVDPRSLMSAWRDMVDDDAEDLPPDRARTLARRLGAGRIVLGEVVSTPDEIVLTASVVATESGRETGPVVVEGPPDSLTSLVDRLVATLLSIEAGEDERRLAQLTSTSLPALRSYLAGRAAYRRGSYDRALERFQQAVAEDSAFALAAIGIVETAGWTLDLLTRDEARRGLRLAWAARERLSPRDRAYLEAIAGPRYPEPTPHAERLAAWDAVVDARPDDANAWYHYGDYLFHYGAAVDIGNSVERARRAFDRALELDSSFASPLQHLLDAAALQRDREALDRLVPIYFERIADSGLTRSRRLLLDVIFGDSADFQAALADLETVPDEQRLFAFGSVYTEFPSERVIELNARSLELTAAAAQTSAERVRILDFRHAFALNRGQPSDALAALDALAESAPGRTREIRRTKVYDALYWDGDAGAAETAAAALEATTNSPETADPVERRERRRDLCALGQWRAHRGQADGAASLVDRLRAAGPEASASERMESELCARLLEALVAAATDAPDAAERIERLDAFVRTGPPVQRLPQHANLTLVRLFEMHGREPAALRAARRIIRLPGAERYRSSFLREEARLAARIGERDAAIAAYRRYLGLRRDAEPSLAEEVRRAERELAALLDPDG